jgi:tetraacyldisaccharide 4'-kinase
VLIGRDVAGAAATLPPDLPVLRARLVQDDTVNALKGRRILAFAGIAHPAKFFAPLAQAGALLVGREPFPDHHPYTPEELQGLLARAKALDALLVTTPKDAVRLPAALRARVQVVGVGLEWEDAAARDALLAGLLGGQDAADKETA